MDNVQIIDPATGKPVSPAVAVVQPTSFKTFQYVTPDTSAHQLYPAGLALVTGEVVIYAKKTNAGVITIGDNNAITTAIDGTGNAWPLEAGASMKIPVDNLNRLYVIGANANDVLFVGAN